MQVWSLGWEDPLEKEMTTHSSILAWEIPWTEKPGGPQSMGMSKQNNKLVNNPNMSQLMKSGLLTPSVYVAHIGFRFYSPYAIALLHKLFKAVILWLIIAPVDSEIKDNLDWKK